MSTTTKFDPAKLDLRSCVPSCQESDLNPALVELIRRAQHMAGFTFTITSGFRSVAHEKSRGRSGSSSHTKGLAVDISARDSHARYKILLALGLSGAPRLGVGETFIHCDIDETKAHPIIFHYYATQ